MNKRYSSQEVVVNFNTRFIKSKNYLLQGINFKKNNIASFKEACWNNLLPDILPELFQDFDEISCLNTWQIRNNPHLLLLEMSERPSAMDFSKSIDPNIFLALSNLN